jgi:hypothetical protein
VTDTVERVRSYAERYFKRSGQTRFPTVRQVAHALGMRQVDVEQAVEDSDATMGLTYWLVEWKEPLGGHFVEVYDPEPAP